MRPSMLVAGAILLASGCASQSVPAHSALPTDQPLEVRLYLAEPTAVKYFVSEPAYVAVFEVLAPPGGQAFLLYRSTSSPSKAGLNTVPSGRERLRFYPPLRNQPPATSPPQRYLYIVASKSSLRLDFDNDDLFRHYVAQNRSFPPSFIGETLEWLNRVVGVKDGEEWSADLFIL